MSILTNFQTDIIKSLSKLTIFRKFFLTGGTALAHFYLQQRYAREITMLPKMIKPVTIKEISEFFEKKITGLSILES